MERIRVVVFGCLLVLGLWFCPSKAYASDGFLGGLEDLVGTREVTTVEPEEQFLEEYEPILLEETGGVSRELPEDATTTDYVNDTVSQFNRVTIGTQNVDLVHGLILFFGDRNYLTIGKTIMVTAIGIVFFWWGVRKTKNMVMNAFRKGKASL